MGNSVELLYKQCYSLLKGLPDQNKIVIGEVYTQGSGDSIDYNCLFVFHPLENTVPLF